MAYTQVKYSEFFTVNGATVPSVAGTAVNTLTLAALPVGLTTANATTYKVWIGPAATAVAYPLTAANTTTKTITIATAVTVTTTTPIWVGIPAAVTANMAQFYIRAGVIIPQGALVRFGAGNENFRASNPSTVASNLVKLSASVSSTSPSIGSTAVLVGGYLAAGTDTIAFTESISKSGIAKAQTLTFNQSVNAYRRITKSSADAITFVDSAATRATLKVSATETLTLASSSKGSAAKQFVYTTDTLTLTEGTAVNKQIILQVADSITFTDVAYLPYRTFTTPQTQVVPPFLPDTRGQAFMLFRHYAPTYRHVNVFQLSNGTYVQDYPTPENSNANVPYPWITDSPQNQYAFVTYFNGTTEAFNLDPHIKRVFWGGEVSLIDQETANQMMREHPLYANYMDVENA